jgi:hypothetical protein
MFPQVSIKHNIGNIIEISNQLNPKVFTYLSNNFAIGVTTLNVDNAIDFTTGSIILLLGSMGAENTEFGYASAHTDQSFTVTATKQPHNRGDLVTQINYDQIVISKSATIDGTYTTLVTLPLAVTQQKTIQFDEAGLSSDYYKVQWKNSLSGELSGFSDPISVLSYPTNSVGSVITPVLKAMGVSENDNRITSEFCIEAINDARKYVNMKLYGIRHAWRSEFEYPLRVLSGSNFVNLPDDIDFDESDRSLLSARFIRGNVLAPFNLKYIDKRSWNQVAFNVGGSVTVGVTSIAANEINLISSGDFPFTTNSGVAYIATTDFDQTMLQIEYTGVDLVLNKLTGVTGIDRQIPAGTQIWVTPTIAQPITYTVFEDKIVFDRIIPDSMQGANCYIDYYKKTAEVTDLYQELKEPYREIYKWYLRYAIKYRKDVTLSQSDPDYKKFEELVQALFNNLYTGQDTIIVTT